MEAIGTLIFLGLIITCITLSLIVSAIRHAHATPLETTKTPWKRCAICGQYQHTFRAYCGNHVRPVALLPLSERLEQRARYHSNASPCWKLTPLEQDMLVAYALRLEELSNEDWTTSAVCQVREHLWESELPHFVNFLTGMEEATGQRLDINDVVEQYLESLVYEDAKDRIAQN